jgi:hypothetical protein
MTYKTKILRFAIIALRAADAACRILWFAGLVLAARASFYLALLGFLLPQLAFAAGFAFVFFDIDLPRFCTGLFDEIQKCKGINNGKLCQLVHDLQK